MAAELNRSCHCFRQLLLITIDETSADAPSITFSLPCIKMVGEIAKQLTVHRETLVGYKRPPIKPLVLEASAKLCKRVAGAPGRSSPSHCGRWGDGSNNRLRCVRRLLNQKLANRLENLGEEPSRIVSIGWGSPRVEGIECFVVPALLLSDNSFASHSARHLRITPRPRHFLLSICEEVIALNVCNG